MSLCLGSAQSKGYEEEWVKTVGIKIQRGGRGLDRGDSLLLDIQGSVCRERMSLHST